MEEVWDVGSGIRCLLYCTCRSEPILPRLQGGASQVDGQGIPLA